MIIGKTVTTELAVYSPGKTRNPHNYDHTPGGSSSGSVAAVACGMIPVAVGTQTNGSMIRPASFCGVFGYKPTFGTIWTLCGLPAITIPLLQGENGLPLGVQLVGPGGDEAGLLRTARWLFNRLIK